MKKLYCVVLYIYLFEVLRGGAVSVHLYDCESSSWHVPPDPGSVKGPKAATTPVHEMNPSCILWQNERKTVVLLDLPRSIEEAQVLSNDLTATNAAAPRKLRRLISALPPTSPFPTPEPKAGSPGQPAASPSAQVAELMTLAAVESALEEIQTSYSGPWCLPRLCSKPNPIQAQPSPNTTSPPPANNRPPPPEEVQPPSPAAPPSEPPTPPANLPHPDPQPAHHITPPNPPPPPAPPQNPPPPQTHPPQKKKNQTKTRDQ
jgi:hypothetical protein